MSSDELNLRRINQDLLLRSLEAQNVGDMAGGNGVEIRFKLNKPVTTADAQCHLRAVIRMKGQRLKGFLGKEFQRGMPGRVMDMEIGLLFQPPPGSGPEVLEILEVSSIEPIAFHILERCLDFPLRFRPVPQRDRLALIMRDKGRKGRIEDRPATLPSEHHRLFAIVKALFRHAAKVREGILMPADQAIEVPVGCKVDVLPSGEAQDIRKTFHLALAGPGERDRIRTLIHLPLNTRFGFESDHRLWI